MLLHHPLRHDELPPDRDVGAPLRQQPEHLALARGQLGERVAAAALGEQCGHDLRIEHGAAADDPVQGVGEIVEPGHAVLEDVADASPGAQGVGGVGLLDVLREHQDRRVRHVAPHLQRRSQPGRTAQPVCLLRRVGRTPDSSGGSSSESFAHGRTGDHCCTVVDVEGREVPGRAGDPGRAARMVDRSRRPS